MLSQLHAHRVAKPWGRDDLSPPFIEADTPEQPRIGELWYQSAKAERIDLLLVKYLFTSEKLSVQVHPDDNSAHQQGHKSGKAECWYVVEALPGAVLGLGLKTPTHSHDLHQAALSGAIEEMIDWKPTKVGDIWYVSPGTVHAIGPGLTLIEIQQNIDLTYRLYDYGRPRELHLDNGIAVARPLPYAMSHHDHYDGDRAWAKTWPHFGMGVCSTPDQAADILRNVPDESYWVPVKGDTQICGALLEPGKVYHMAGTVDPGELAMQQGSVLLIGWPANS